MKKINKYDLSDVRKIMNEVEKKYGCDLSDINVTYNGRLTRALARCMSRREINIFTGEVVSVVPYELQFGKTILNVGNYETFEQTVLHEVAHIIANRENNAQCGHDERFKRVCRKIGCYNDGVYNHESFSEDLQNTHLEIEAKKQNVDTTEVKKHKYEVVCKECGKTYYYNRMSKNLKSMENGKHSDCYCGRCHNDTFDVRKNW